jgi:hypothetical protein
MKVFILGDTDVRDACIAKADYLSQIGSKTEAIALYKKGNLNIILIGSNLKCNVYFHFPEFHTSLVLQHIKNVFFEFPRQPVYRRLLFSTGKIVLQRNLSENLSPIDIFPSRYIQKMSTGWGFIFIRFRADQKKKRQFSLLRSF